MFYYYGYNDSHSISGGKSNKEDYPSKSFKRSIKRYKNLLDRKLGWNNWVQSVIGFNVLSLIHCSGSWSASTRNIIKNFFLPQSRALVIKTVFSNYEIGHTMEVLSSSFSSFFISSQMLDKDIYTHKALPGDQYRTAIQLWTVSSPRSGNFI